MSKNLQYKRGATTVFEMFEIKQLLDDGSLVSLDDEIPLDAGSLDGCPGFSSEFESRQDAIDMLSRYPYELDDILIVSVFRVRR